jgi:hypothetical protein
MSENTVSIPTWAMPIVISGLGVAIAYGSSMAEAEATKAEVKRVEAAVVEVIKESNANGKAVALNSQAIQQIAKGLADQQETAKASDEKLAQLITIMLEQKNR